MELDVVPVAAVIEPAGDSTPICVTEVPETEVVPCENTACVVETTEKQPELAPPPQVDACSDSDSEHDQDINDAFCSVCTTLDGGTCEAALYLCCSPATFRNLNDSFLLCG